MIELNKMTAIEAKLDVIINILNNQERRNHSAREVGIVEDVEKKNEEGLAHEVPIIRRKHSIFKEIRAIILSSTTTFQPITHQPLETTRTYLMEVDCSRVKD